MSGIKPFVSDSKIEHVQGDGSELEKPKAEDTDRNSDSDFDVGVFTQANPIPPKPVKRKVGSKSRSGREKKKAKISGNVLNLLFGVSVDFVIYNECG